MPWRLRFPVCFRIPSSKAVPEIENLICGHWQVRQSCRFSSDTEVFLITICPSSLPFQLLRNYFSAVNVPFFSGLVIGHFSFNDKNPHQIRILVDNIGM